MTSYLIKRLLQSLFAVWGVVTLVFLILQLSGDPALLLAPEGATGEDIALIRSQLGLDRSMIVQYGHYFWDLLPSNLANRLIQPRNGIP